SIFTMNRSCGCCLTAKCKRQVLNSEPRLLVRPGTVSRWRACALSGFDAPCLTISAECNSAGRTDLEVYVPTAQTRAIKCYSGLPCESVNYKQRASFNDFVCFSGK